MRTIILITVFVILSKNTTAQSYIPMVREGNKWHMLSQGEYYGGGGINGDSIRQMNLECLLSSGLYKKTYISKIGGDSAVGQITYKKILESHDSLANVWKLTGLIREDTIEQIVYYKDSNDDEKILYSFNVKVKDTVGIMVVQYVDTILINNKPHKRIGVTWGRTWIEGIGGLSGLLTSSFDRLMCGPRQTLLCAYHNDSLLYKIDSKEYTKCFYWEVIHTGLDAINGSINFNVYPNPATDNITIKINSDEVINLKIKDLQGRTLLNQKIHNRDARIDVNSIKSGIYFVEISDGSNYSVTKLIKNE